MRGEMRSAGAWLALGCALLLAACLERPLVRPAASGDYQISGSARDAHNTVSANLPTNSNVRMGQGAQGDITSGYQFAAIAIARGSAVISATLSVNVSAVQGSGWSLRIRAEAADDCINFQTSWPASRTLTTAGVVWPIGAGTGWKTSPDISAVLQEVIIRPGWATGNDLCLIVQDNQESASTFQDAIAYDADPANAARLSAGYSEPTPTPSATATQTATPTSTPTATATPTITLTPTPTWPCGQILADTTWSGVQSLTCNVAVPPGVTLTLEPGTTVRSGSGVKWDVFGALQAAGSPQQPITLTASAGQQRGSWGPLFIRGSANLDYVTMTYGTGLEIAAPAAISHSLFMSNSIGIDMLAAGSVCSSTLAGNGTGLIVRGNVTPALQAVNVLPSNDLGLWNAQEITLTVPRLWWGVTAAQDIESLLLDRLDDYRLGPVQWQPAASSAW